MDSPTNHPWLSHLAKLCVLATFALILIGGMVTTSGAGMAASTAPHVNGTLVNPSGWFQDPALRLEHGHRLAAMTVALLTGILCAGLWRNWLAFVVAIFLMGLADAIGHPLHLSSALIAQLRIWPAMILFIVLLLAGARRHGRTPGAEQWMALVAYVAVGLQALMGTLRVNLETSGDFSAALNLRTFHGVFAQAFLALMVVLAARLSPVWREISQRPSIEAAPKIRRMAIIALALYFAQLACAAYLRHRGLGLIIPTWPGAQQGGGFIVIATESSLFAARLGGGLLPAAWNHAIAIHFLHSRVLPILLTGHILGMAIVIAKRAYYEPRLTRLGWGLLLLIVVQFALGVMIIWQGRHPHITNTHVVTGALICATAALLTTRAGRLGHSRGW